MKTLLEYLFGRSKNDTASVARERLSIIVAREGRNQKVPTYLPQLKRELLEVLAKYEKINLEQVTVNVEHQGDCEVLELNVILGERGADTGATKAIEGPEPIQAARRGAKKVVFPPPQQPPPVQEQARDAAPGAGRAFAPVVPARPASREATPLFDRPAPAQSGAGSSPS